MGGSTAKLRIAAAPPHPTAFATLRRSTSPRTRGEVKKQSHSRGAFFAPELCQTANERPPEQIKGGGAPKDAPAMSALHIQALPPEHARARKRAIADKCTQSAHLICFRGPLAFRRSTAALVQHRMLWLDPGRASRERAGAGVTRATDRA
jgi:hypothetical protein